MAQDLDGPKRRCNGRCHSRRWQPSRLYVFKRNDDDCDIFPHIIWHAAGRLKDRPAVVIEIGQLELWEGVWNVHMQDLHVATCEYAVDQEFSRFGDRKGALLHSRTENEVHVGVRWDTVDTLSEGVDFQRIFVVLRFTTHSQDLVPVDTRGADSDIDTFVVSRAPNLTDDTELGHVSGHFEHVISITSFW